ncbi:TPA: hypothetical protein HA281_04760 [Candidatus Woesearchaeota archaeon]|nr:hypothetical protein [Candidatus Woesearchaeota archaeon]
MTRPTNPGRGTRAQVQMGETIAILLVFFFFVVIGMVFYVNIIKSKSATEREENTQLEAITVLKKALALPELQCSRQNIVEDSCIDLLKLQAASIVVPQHQEYYFDSLGFSVVSVQEVYPSTHNYTLYNSPLDKYSSKSVTNAPISLLDPVTGTNAFGVITIDTYAR